MKKNNQQGKISYFEYLALVFGFGIAGLALVYFGLGMLVHQNFLAEDFQEKFHFVTIRPMPPEKEVVAMRLSVRLEAETGEENEMLKIAGVEYSDRQNSPLSTQVYPGYTMTFDVVANSPEDPNPNQVPIFLYTILDEQEEEVFRTAEERIIAGETKFSKKITLPRDLDPGRYKLRIESKIGNNKYTEERYFEVEQSPVLALGSNFAKMISNLVSGIGWIVIVFILIFLSLVIFAIVERRIHSGQRHWDSPRAEKSSH